MRYEPIKTRIMQPPKDDLFAVFDESLHGVEEGDIVAISSKVVAIHEGRCVPLNRADKKTLIKEESDLVIERPYWGIPLTITRSAFIGAAGIDESNSDGYYTLLPVDAFKNAKEIHSYLVNRFNIKNIGVLIIDSHSAPLRRGATGVSIGFWGFKPTKSHVGKPDLFGREMRIEVSNVADALAAGANIVMGETNESQPITIIKGAPGIEFTDTNQKDELFVGMEKDTFRVLYEDFLT